MDALQPQEAPCRLFERKIAPFICTVANFLVALLLFCRVSRFGGEIDCSGVLADLDPLDLDPPVQIR